jgi:phosphate transport system protein
MTVHFQKELATLKKRIIRLSATVEENVRKAVHSVNRRDAALAREVVQADRIVDQGEVEVEEECLKILALYQPVAIDLRFIVGVLKLNNDLERIGDLALSIAKHAIKLSDLPEIRTVVDFSSMMEHVVMALQNALDALIELDAELAEKVLRDDDAIDDLHRGIKEKLVAEMTASPADLPVLMHQLQISRRLERIADHATNIAEDVIYMVDARIVRHNPDAVAAPGE